MNPDVRKDKKKILAVASIGGHWVQLLRITAGLSSDYEVSYVSSNPKWAECVSGKFYSICEFSRWDAWKMFFCIPYVLILVRSRLAGLDPAYEEAARDLGASPMKALLTVTVPLIAPAILSGVFLAFAMSLDDFVISFFVKGAESTTYPVYVYGRVKTSVPPTVNAMCTVMLGVTLLAVALSQLFKTRKR